MISYSDLVATLAALMSLVSLGLHYLRYRHQQQDIAPDIRLKVGKPTEIPGWINITVYATNNDMFSLAGESVTMIKPAGGLLAPFWECGQSNGFGPFELSPELITQQAARIIPFKIELKRLGVPTIPRADGGPTEVGDSYHERLLIYLPPRNSWFSRFRRSHSATIPATIRISMSSSRTPRRTFHAMIDVEIETAPQSSSPQATTT